MDRSTAKIQRFQPTLIPATKSIMVNQQDGDELNKTEEEISHLKMNPSKHGGYSTKLPQAGSLECGGNHLRANCKFKATICRRCGKKDHLANVCRATLLSADQPHDRFSGQRIDRNVGRPCEDCFAIN